MDIIRVIENLVESSKCVYRHNFNMKAATVRFSLEIAVPKTQNYKCEQLLILAKPLKNNFRSISPMKVLYLKCVSLPADNWLSQSHSFVSFFAKTIHNFTAFQTLKSSHQRCSIKIGIFKTYNVIKKETMAQVFSCEFCKIYKNTFILFVFFFIKFTAYYHTEIFCTLSFIFNKQRIVILSSINKQASPVFKLRNQPQTSDPCNTRVYNLISVPQITWLFIRRQNNFE